MLPGAGNEEETVEFSFMLNDVDDYAELLKTYRKKHKLKQQELAEIMGIKHTTLRSWEQGLAKPPYNVWRKIKRLIL